ncbi:MAG TPA: glycogen-binding domain-containing protein [Phycisphaerae bacterium]|nr:glycogen-binding domain-containing protein [Phycisphaerae bacterium]
MIMSGRKKGTVRFSLRCGDTVRSVCVAGDFSDWEALPMRKREDTFAVTVPLDPGSHQYKFILDDRWQTDPDNEHCAVSELGTVNSVAVVA